MPCFAVDRSDLFDMYAALLDLYPGWTLEDVRGLTRAEREFLLDIAYWRLEKRQRG